MLEGKSALVRWSALLGGIALMWLVNFVALPALRDTSPFFMRMAEFVRESGIETGEFYYTDVEVCAEANIGTRSTFDYMPMGR